MFLRITDKEGNFLRDGETFDPEIEIGLDVEPPQEPIYKPKRIGFDIDPVHGTQWIEGATQEYIDEILNQATTEPQPTLEDLAEMVQKSFVAIMELSIGE